MMNQRTLKILVAALLLATICDMGARAAVQNVGGTLTFQRVKGDGSTAPPKSNRVVVTFGEVRNTDIYPVFITGMYSSESTTDFNFNGFTVSGVYNAATKKFQFPKGQTLCTWTDGQAQGKDWWYNVRPGTVDNQNDIMGKLGNDGKTITLGGSSLNSQYPYLAAVTQIGNQIYIDFRWQNNQIVLDEAPQIAATSEEVDIYMDDNITNTDNEGHTFAYQRAFRSDEYPPEVVINHGGVSYITNPCLSRGAVFKGFDANNKAAIEAAGYSFDMEEFANASWYPVGTEASIHTTDGFMKKLAIFCANKSDVFVARTDPDGYFTDADVTTHWIDPGHVKGVYAESYDEHAVSGSDYSGTIRTGAHFKDAFPHFTNNGDDFTVDYVIYWRGKVQNTANFGNTGMTTYQYLDQNAASLNSSFIKFNGTWWYYAIPDAEHRYVAPSASDGSLPYQPPEPSGQGPRAAVFTTPVGYHFQAHFNSDVVTGVTQVNALKEVVSTCYINLQGMRSSTPWPGVNIVERTYSNGARKVSKEFK